jgi:sporulation protein YlmC with PRC-barrel domain
MDLVRDLLDKRVVDRNGRDMGRVDRVVLQMRAGQPVQVTGIEIGPSALAHRLTRIAGCVAEALECVFGVRKDRPVRIPFSEITDTNNSVRVTLAVGETAASAVEHRVRRWIGSLPRSS